jgi:alpha-galactosidase
MKKYMTNFLLFILLISCFQSSGCEKGIIIEGEEITIEFNQDLHSRVISKIDGENIILGDFGPSEYINAGGYTMAKFLYKSQKTAGVDDQIGKGTLYTLIGESELLLKTIKAIAYENFPKMILYLVTYKNLSDELLQIESWTNNRYLISSDPGQPIKEFKSFQSGSYKNFQDWIIYVSKGFAKQNLMELHESDYKDYPPISDVWRKDIGLSVGHVEFVSKPISLPVEMPDSRGAFLRVNSKVNRELKSGESFTTLQTFVSVHKGDCFTTLTGYRRLMEKKGVKFDSPQDSTIRKRMR